MTAPPRKGADKTRRRKPSPVLVFWLAVAVILAGGIGVLQYLGPPRQAPQKPPPPVAAGKPAPVAATKPTPVAAPVLPQLGTGSTLAPGSPIPAPIPALLAPSSTNSGWLIPRIGADGQAPMRAYAAGTPKATGPQMAILLAGIGDDEAASQQAITMLPASVSLAVTPYGSHLEDIPALARAAGHELLLAIPMQEANPATQNAGNEALMVSTPITRNQPMLDWSLSRVAGYAGATDAIGASQGAGFMGDPNARTWLLQEIADDGLFFIDARPGGAVPFAWGRGADVVIDPVNAPQQQAAQLAELASDARVEGDALGILLSPAPNALRGLAAWLQTLPAQGITLVPVSALVLPPSRAATPPPALPATP